MLNIIVQNLLEKKTKEIDPKNIQNPNALTTVHKLDGGKNLENNTKENQVAHFWGWTVRPTKINWEEKWWKT